MICIAAIGGNIIKKPGINRALYHLVNPCLRNDRKPCTMTNKFISERIVKYRSIHFCARINMVPIVSELFYFALPAYFRISLDAIMLFGTAYKSYKDNNGE